jgi:hypothetical protein
MLLFFPANWRAFFTHKKNTQMKTIVGLLFIVAAVSAEMAPILRWGKEGRFCLCFCVFPSLLLVLAWPWVVPKFVVI